MKKATTSKESKGFNRGITLIALVITIIVLLILAAVSIATLTGENGILTKANSAKEETNEATVKEKVQVAVMGSYGKDGKIDLADLKRNLDKVEGITGVPDPIPEGDFSFLVDGYQVKIQSTGNVEVTKSPSKEEDIPTFDPSTLTIGEAINKDKYGWKVKEYNVTTDDFTTGVWRLFFQDNQYTYLITDECVGSYNPEDYFSPFTEVGIVGKKLNLIVEEILTNKCNKNKKITAWLTDTEETSMWKNYKNKDAVFAIGSPTAELFEASYNSNHGDKLISVSLGSYGYDYNVGNGYFSVNDNYGIYNKSTSSSWWIASPHTGRGDDLHELYVDATNGCFEGGWNSSFAVRPLVCIPTSTFNDKYTLVNE